MSYGLHPFGGVGFAGADVDNIPQADTRTTLSVEVAFTTDALADPVWVDVTSDVRSWDVSRGRSRELERFQPGRATVVLGNLSRQYDSVNAAAAQFGNIRPGKRMRIRETFNGVTYPVFDGFVDKWALDYPDKGKDAIAVLTATDGFKFLARAELDRSVYWDAVDDDAPAFWWRFHELLKEGDAERVALNSGTVGAAGNGTYVGAVTFGAPPMIVNDPDQAIAMTSSDVFAGTPVSGVNIPSAQINMLSRVNSRSAFTLEVWARPKTSQTQALVFFERAFPAGVANFALFWFNNTGAGNTGEFLWRLSDDVLGTFDLESGDSTAPPGARYHVVLTGEAEGANLRRRLYLNGTQVATDTVAGTTFVETSVDHNKWGGGVLAGSNFTGELQGAAIYLQALSAVRILAHYNAGTTPWQGDLPGARIARALDEASWPSTLRELDTGLTTFQSATIGQPALEHLQKASESEYGSLLFMNRGGKVRFVGRTAAFAREPGPTVYGDLAGEVGYTAFTPDDGDEVIRNKAVVSRLDGVAKVAEDATSQGDFGRSDYVREGLLHNSETESLAHASFIVGEYADQKRRITSLDLGPPIAGLEGTVYPAMLGPELGDAIRVRSRPLGGGALFEQVCAIEGIRAQGAPGGVRQTTFALSPEYALRTLEDVDVATLGYAESTTTQAGVGAEVDVTGCTVTVTVGSSRRIRVTGRVGTSTASVADVGVFVLIKDGSTEVGRGAVTVSATAREHTCHTMCVLTPSAGSKTYKLTLQAVGGTIATASLANAPNFILVEDVGPV